MSAREGLAQIIWETSRADEGTISATGANIVADAILAAGFTLPGTINDAQVEAAAWAIRKDDPVADTYGFEDYRAMARAALEAARGVT